MSETSILTNLRASATNEHQLKIGIAQLVKTCIEGVISTGRVFSLATYGISAGIDFDDIDVVFDAGVESYEITTQDSGRTLLRLSSKGEQPNAEWYLTLLEAIGAVKVPGLQYRTDFVREGTSWVNKVSADLYHAFTQAEMKETAFAMIGEIFFNYLKCATPVFVDHHPDWASFEPYWKKGLDETELNSGIITGVINGITGDTDAVRFAKIFIGIQQTPSSGDSYNKPGSAEFMSSYLIACFN